MKRISITVAMLTLISLLLLGCSSPAEQAQKMMTDGKYQELVTKFGNDPAMANMVEQAKNKLAEGLLKEGKYAEVLEMYPESPSAKEAKNMMAKMLFDEGKYEELIATYPDTPAAIQARMMMEKARGDSLQEVAGEQSKDLKQAGADLTEAKKTIERAAERELERIQGIKNPRLRATELKNFVENPKFKGTQAAKQAKAELDKASKG